MSEEEKKAIELLSKKNTEYYYRYIDVREAVSIVLNLIENQQKELNNLKEIEKKHKEENGKLRVELEQEKARNEKLQYKIDEKELIIDGMKEERRIAIEEIREEYYISKDKLKFILSKLNISDIEPWSTYKIDGQILFDLQELL